MPLVPKRVKHRRKAWISIYPQKSYTAKGVGVRMGSGKGAPAGWVAVVKREKILFEIGGVSEEVAREALRRASTKFVTRSSEVGGESNEG